MTHNDIGLGDLIGNIRPIAKEFTMRDTALHRRLGVDIEHALLVVHRDDFTSGGHEGERGPASPATDVQDGAACRQGFACASMGRGIGDFTLDREHRHRMDPWWFSGQGQDFIGDGP